MRIQDIKIGEYYRHKTTPDYAWAKVIAILKPKEYPNTNTYSVVKCEWTVSKGDLVGMIKYYKPSDLMKS